MRVSSSAREAASTVIAQPGCTRSVSRACPMRVAQYRPALEIQTPHRGCLARASARAPSPALTSSVLIGRGPLSCLLGSSVHVRGALSKSLAAIWQRLPDSATLYASPGQRWKRRRGTLDTRVPRDYGPDVGAVTS